VIETKRLSLRHVHDSDAPFILELLTDKDFLVNVGDRGVHDLSSARRYIEEGPLASYRSYGFGLYLAELRSTTLALGLCGLLRRDSHPDVELGFALLPRARGFGYALEAVQGTMKFATHVLGLKRIVAIAAPHNQASIRILQRVGLRFERIVQWTRNGEDSRLYVYGA
jgi:[ribosomal protein S5]-alanine N-acetyltransferase